jgi:hypothetical protein
MRHPLLEQRDVIALHQLEAAAEVGLYPAVDVAKPVGEHPALLPDPAVDVPRAPGGEPLDDHEQHA